MKPFLLPLVPALLSIAPAGAVPKDPPAIAVTIQIHEEPKPHILAAIWPDGTIIWSEDQKNGGPPYLTAKIDAAKLTAFLAKLEKESVFKKTADGVFQTGPDSSYHRIDLLSGKKHGSLASWHELFERNPKLVVSSHGVSSLDGRTREQVMREDEQAYRDFRTLWKEIRDFTRGLIPKKGERYEGELKFKYPD